MSVFNKLSLSFFFFFFFCKQFLALRKGEDSNDANKCIQSITSINGPNGRFLGNAPSNQNFLYGFLEVADKATQTILDYNSTTPSARTEENGHSSFDK